MPVNPEELAAAVMAQIKSSIAIATAPLVARIAALEVRLEAVQTHAAHSRSDMTRDIQATVSAQVASAIASLPAPKDGKDGRDGIDGKDGRDGNDGERGPQGERGERGETGAAGEKGDKGDTGERGLTGEKGLDGIGLVGPVGPQGERGERGSDGRDGRDGERGLKGDTGERGERGADGLDGFSLTDFSAEFDGERRVTFKLESADLRKSHTFVVPWQLYRDVFKEGQPYERGDVVTWGGSTWVAKEDTTDKPGLSPAWQLSCKRGSPGKAGPQGAIGPAGPRGERGEPGRYA